MIHFLWKIKYKGFVLSEVHVIAESLESAREAARAKQDRHNASQIASVVETEPDEIKPIESGLVFVIGVK